MANVYFLGDLFVMFLSTVSFAQNPLKSFLSARCSRLLIRGIGLTVGIFFETRGFRSGACSMDLSDRSFSPLSSILDSYKPIRALDADLIFAYNPVHKTPDWVYERICSDNLKGKNNRKSCHFQEDEELPLSQRSFLKDYEGSGYSRGHMATCSNYRNDKKKMKKTFVLSMICPQIGSRFNSGIWSKIEQVVQEKIRHLQQGECAHIITGPLFLAQKEDGKVRVSYEVIGNRQVSVATHFFKIIFFEKEGSWETLSYLVPHRATAAIKNPEDFLTTIDKIEQISGLIFTQGFNTFKDNLR